MAASVQIRATGPGGTTLGKFSEILSERIKWLGESARGSIIACALDVLRSIRAATMKAKASTIKPELKRQENLHCSFRKKGRENIPCLRIIGSEVRYVPSERVVYAQPPLNTKQWGVWKMTDPYRQADRGWLICAPSAASAKSKGKEILVKRKLRYAGLAKRAVSLLMQKTYGKGQSDNVPPYVTKKANENTRVNEFTQRQGQDGSGVYALKLLDNLNYALDAIRGGKAGVDVAYKKAINKITATFNRKLKDPGTFFGPQKMDVPFPEVKQRR